MESPFKHRPGPDDLDWEDNWLSNSLAWFSAIFMSKWCKEERHWTLVLFNYLYAECGCCLIFRGLSLGFLLGVAVSSIAVTATVIFF